MNPISTSVSVLDGAFARLDRASAELIGAVSGDPNADESASVVGQIQAKAQLQSGIATVRIADTMMQALLDISRHG